MAQFSTTRNSLLNNNDDLYEVVMVSGQAGPSVYVPAGNLNAGSDAFGRLRVSHPHTLFDNSFRYDLSSQKWREKYNGTGSIAHNANEGLVDITIGTADGDEVIRETSKVFQYQPGKSLLTMNTFVMGAPKTNVRMRIGYFGINDGLFFERAGTTNKIVLRSSVSGSPVDAAFNQNEWNVDRLDGTGPSDVVLNSAKAQIFWTDVEWLGVGSVRAGFVINGQFVVCHIFHHANTATSTYMRTATLPIRYEVTNTGASAGATLKQICSTVVSEGGYTPLSLTRSASTDLAGKNVSDVNLTPLVSLRLKPNRTDAVVVPSRAEVYGLQQAAFKYALVRQPTLTSASWVNLDSSSSVQYDISATALTGGTIVAEGFFVGDTKGGAEAVDLSQFNSTLQLARGIIEADSAGEVFTLAALATTNNDDAVGSMTWQEHT